MREQYGKLTTAVRRQVARELRRERARGYPLTPWDTCLNVASRYSPQSIAYRIVREVAIKFKPTPNAYISNLGH